MTTPNLTPRSVLPLRETDKPKQFGLKFYAPYQKRAPKRGHGLHCDTCDGVRLHEVTQAGAVCQGTCTGNGTGREEMK